MKSDSSSNGFVSTDRLLPSSCQQDKKRTPYECTKLIHVISCITCLVACFVTISCAIYSFNATQTINKTNAERTQHDAATTFKSGFSNDNVKDSKYVDDTDDSELDNSFISRAKRATNGDRKAQKPGKKLSIPAAHFEGLGTGEYIQSMVEKYNHLKETASCRHIKDIEGMLCRNRTFIPDGNTLRIFANAAWAENAFSPVIFQNSVLYVKTGGVYYVYAQVLMSGTLVANAASIVQKRNGEEITSMSCRTCRKCDQTCSVSGLMKLQANDTLEIQKNQQTTEIDAGPNATYFGVFQLSQENTKRINNTTDNKNRNSQKQ